MKTLNVNITITKNGKQGYICTCKHTFKNFDLGGSGNTVAEAKEDCFTFYKEMKELYPNEELPKLSVNWLYDLPSFFNQFRFLNATKVAEHAGINPSNFRHYVAGSKPVTQKQLGKIQNTLKKIANEMYADSQAVIIS